MEYLNEELNKEIEKRAIKLSKGQKVYKNWQKKKKRKNKENKPINYLRYIKSKKWFRKRLEVYQVQKECFGCGIKNNLDVHHLTYKNLGKEKLEDLITLCRKCHSEVHYEREEKLKRLLL